MLPAGSKASGTCLGAPDVCQMPAVPSPIPTPYANTAMLTDAMKTSTKVLIENKETVIETSEIPSSNGDQGGSIGGVISGTVANKVVFRKASSKVKFEGKGAVFHTAATAHNGANANAPAGVHVAPSQTKVLVMP